LVTLLAACTHDTGGAVDGTGAKAASRPQSGALRGQLPPAVAEANAFRVAMRVGRAPFGFYATGTRQILGIEYEMMASIADALGVKLAITDVSAEGMARALAGHRVDAAVSLLPDTRQNEGFFDFVDYLLGQTQLLVRDGNPDHVTGMDDLCGRVIGVQISTASASSVIGRDAQCRQLRRPAIMLRQEQDNGELMSELGQGQLTGVATDSIVALYSAHISYGPTALQVVGAPVDRYVYGIAVPKDRPQLRDAIAAALRTLMVTGTYDEIIDKWGAATGALRTAAVNGGG